MKKITLTIIFLFLTNTIFADGIISNLQQYLQKHPDRISADGWVTIPLEILKINKEPFGLDCEYRAEDGNHSWQTSGYISESLIEFGFPWNTSRFMYIQQSNKSIITEAHESKNNAMVIKLQQRSPASIAYTKKREQNNINVFQKFNGFLEQITQQMGQMNNKMNNLQKRQENIEIRISEIASTLKKMAVDK